MEYIKNKLGVREHGYQVVMLREDYDLLLSDLEAKTKLIKKLEKRLKQSRG